jgi:hypothetical protein
MVSGKESEIFACWVSINSPLLKSEYESDILKAH